MAINFPDSPIVGEQFTAAGRTWVWDGTTWNNDSTADYASVQFDTTAGIVAGIGELAWNAEQETLDLGLDANVTLQLGQEQLIRVKNASGTTAIPNGTFVQFAGAAGDTVTVEPAITDGSVQHEYMVGVTTEEIPADGFGFVTTQGVVGGLNTSVWPVGTILYPDPTTAGNFTATEPTAPNLKLPIAAVIKQGAGTSGKILVRMRVGEVLNDIHNVQITSPAANQALQYDGTKWVNSAITTAEISDLTATAAELNVLDGITATTTELNYTDGVTSNIQTQLNDRAVSHNYIINGAFDIWQRGTDPFTIAGANANSAYTADRFHVVPSGGTGVITRETFTPGELATIGFGEAQHYLKMDVTTGDNFYGGAFRIEDVTQLAGQTVTVSFWAKGVNPQPDGYIRFFVGQQLLTGSTSYTEDITITSTWQRYSFTKTLADLSGKTYDSTSYLSLGFYQGTFGADPWEISIWGVQLEAGSVATPFKRHAPSLQGELAACKRYYQRLQAYSGAYATLGFGSAISTTVGRVMVPLPVEMRATPSLLPVVSAGNYDLHDGAGGITATAVSLGGYSPSKHAITLQVTVSSGLTQFRPVMFIVDNNDAYLELNAEL